MARGPTRSIVVVVGGDDSRTVLLDGDRIAPPPSYSHIEWRNERPRSHLQARDNSKSASASRIAGGHWWD
jgi:hypothetical protein